MIFGLPDKELDFKSFEGKYVYFRDKEGDHIGKLDKVAGNRIIVSKLAGGIVTEKCIKPAILDDIIFDISSITQMGESSEEERDNLLKLKYRYNDLIGEYIRITSNGNTHYGKLDRITLQGFELKPSLRHKPLEYGFVLKLEERLPFFIEKPIKTITPSSEKEIKVLIERSKREYKLQEKEEKLTEKELEKRVKESQ